MYDFEGVTLVKVVTSVAKDASEFYFVVMFVTKSAMVIHLVESAQMVVKQNVLIHHVKSCVVAW